MENILLILISFELLIILVTKIVELTKLSKSYTILVMTKNILAGVYELFGGIAPDMEIIGGENFPEGKEKSFIAEEGLE